MSFENGIVAVIKNSRWYSSDMTVFSSLVCFLYALSCRGNILNGIVAFIGILFAHMATNLYDDYDDYKILCTELRFNEFSPDVKCAYLKNGTSTTKDLLFVIISYCFIAFFSGLFLFFRTGFPVVVLALIGGIIVLSYPKISRVGLSEIAVGIAFGPLLFEGMYYVMTKSFSLMVLLLSFAIVMFTIGVMYNHTILDFEGDKISGKKTIVQRIGNKDKALIGFILIYVAGYLFTALFSVYSRNYFCFLSLLTIPFVVMLYKALKSYNATEFYARNENYLSILVGSAKVMAVFSFFVAVGLFIKLLINFV